MARTVAVVGAVGAGKTALLSGALGEMYITTRNVAVKGRVAYVPQQAWILNATLHENILFGCQYEEKRYQEILAACCLVADLATLSAADFTEIGERGVNLSGGQKQRISLARPLYYQNCDIYLLDDPLSAVGVHVQKELFHNVIGPNGLLSQKTRILVTHAVKFLCECDEIVILKDSQVMDFGKYNAVIKRHPRRFIELELGLKQEELDQKETETDKGKTTISNSDQTANRQEVDPGNALGQGKLVQDEKFDIGMISWSSFWLYCKTSGICLLCYCAVTIVLVLIRCCGTFFYAWLQIWTDSAAFTDNENLSNYSASISNWKGTGILALIVTGESKIIGIIIYD